MRGGVKFVVICRSKNETNRFDWIDNLDPAVRHYSGTATCSTTVAPDALFAGDGRLVLDLGEVRHVAAIGKGTVPFRLEVRITNLWPNRLIADSALPKDKQLTRTNINPYKPGASLLSSGLLGPVALVRR